MRLSLKHNVQQRRAALAKAVAAACEALEGRTLFAVALVTDTDGNLGVQVTGTAGNDNITITEDPVAGTATVTGAGTSPAIPTGTEITFFDISTFGGNDNVTFELTTDYGNDVRSIHADLGTGNDSFRFDTDGALITDDSSINLDIEGMSGNDTITLDIDDVRQGGGSGGSTLFAHLNGLDGNDLINVDVDSVTSSSSDINIYTGIGTNTVNVDHGYVGVIGDIPTPTPAASVKYTIRGDAGTDSVTVDLLEETNEPLQVNAFLGGGNDKLVTTFGADFDVTGGGVHLNLNGGLGNDSMTVLAADSFSIGAQALWSAGISPSVTTSGGASLEIAMQGSSGNDSLVVNLIGNSGTGRVSLQDGNLKIRQAGEDGNDDISTRLGFNVSSAAAGSAAVTPSEYVTVGTVDVRVTGDNGNDRQRVTLIENESGPPPTPGIAYRGGSILFDGGAGVDTRDAFPAVTGVPVTFLRFDAKV